MTYKELATQALAAEGKAQWTEAARLWDLAKEEARAKKRSSAEAVTHAMEARRKAEAGAAEHAKTVGQLEAEGFVKPDLKVVEGGKGKAPKADAKKERAKRAAAASASRAETEAKRAAQAGLEPGATVKHTRQGVAVAECTYVAPGRWEYKGKTYTSCSAAGMAAAADIGMKPGKRGFNSIQFWKWWGIEKREDA